jgi:MFS family permease
MHSFATLHSYTRRPPPAPPKLPPPPLLLAALRWWAAWAIPGLGMFSEAYIIFSIGLIAPLQAAAYPECFRDHIVCTREETHAAAYAPVAAIIGGMLVFGFAGDALGRRCGSRAVAGVMLLGSLLLTASPAISDPRAYLQFSVFAQTLYGFGVGGEVRETEEG